VSTIWHAAQAGDVLAALDTTPDGLADAEAARRLAQHGPNQLAPPKKTAALAILAAQLNSVIAFLLVAAAGISLAFGDRLEAGAIAAVLAINTLIGFVTELRARRAMEALVDLDVPHASVIRGGNLAVIDARALVPGDVIALETGRFVPADARLLTAADLGIDEAPLTGESLPVEKAAGTTLAADTPLADRANMVYKGTTVVSGIGRAAVTATGALTEVGRIGVLVGEVKLEPTPLERRLDALGHRLVWLTLGVAAIVAVLGVAQGLPIASVIETAIALAIAAVPEALPVVATIALAVGVSRMARRHALVRRLPAVESLGSTTVVCTDKTRTLTSGEMTVARVWAGGHDVRLDAPLESMSDAAREAVRALLEAAAMASRMQPKKEDDAQAWQGDPVDVAMLAAAERQGIGRAALVAGRREVGLLPFSSDRKLMASFHEVDGATVAFAKGAPRAIFDACRIDGSGAKDLESVNEAFAADGLRVLAVASGRVAAPTSEALSGLTFVGFIGLVDPPASGVKDTIQRLREAGLRTVMLTGDQRLTAEAIGRSLGLLDPGARAIDGREIDARPKDAPAADLAAYAAFSRITPEHKLAIVRAFQARGEIVAMLGDGVNDAAALRQADVGVAMGRRGTDVAKQAAAIVLQDDRFDTVAVAVEEGRVIFDNIRKFVFYLFSCNVAEVLVVLGASVAGLPLPLLPLQLLWLNLVTDTFPALALAMEPAEADVMRRPPRRPGEAVLSRAFITSILFYASLITASALAAFIWAGPADVERARTMAFMTLAIAQTLHLGNARSRGPVVSLRRAFANPYAIGAVGLSVALQLATAAIPPLAAILRVAPLSWTDWLVVAGLACAPAVVGQVKRGSYLFSTDSA
jgi:Ca2+-transporting ATPase